MKKYLCLLPLIGALFAVTPNLEASLITYDFTGRTANAGDGVFASFANVGFSGSFTYNNSTLKPYGTSQGTSSLQSLIINFDNGESISAMVNWSMTHVITTWGLSSEGPSSIFMGQVTYGSETPVAFSPADGLSFLGMSFTLPNSVGSNALTNGFPSLTGVLGQVNLGNGTTSIGLAFTQGTLALHQTPEPGSMILVLTGGVAVLLARQKLNESRRS